jgi:hypothetical protein
MSWFRDISQCSRCGYEYADIQKHTSGHWNIIFCDRCGYLEDKRFDWDKYESLTNDPGYEEEDDKKLLEQATTCKIIFPPGSYLYRRKGKDKFTVDSIEDGTIENLLEHLDEYDMCRYTFFNIRSWYFKDLLSNTTALFSLKEYFMCEDESDRREEPNFKSDGIFVSWFDL